MSIEAAKAVIESELERYKYYMARAERRYVERTAYAVEPELWARFTWASVMYANVKTTCEAILAALEE